MKARYLLSYLYSNKYLLVILVLIPFVLSIAFGYTLYGDHNLGQDYREEAGLDDKTHGGSFLASGNRTDWIYDTYFDLPTLRPKLGSLESIRFSNSFFDALRQTSRVSMFLGGTIAVVSGGKIISNGSIIYSIVNKENRLKSFLEFFSLPLPFLSLTVVMASLSMTTITLNSFGNISAIKIFGISLFTLFLSALYGFIFANLFVLLFRDTNISLLSLFGVVFVVPLAPRGSLLINPFYYIGNNIFYDMPLPLAEYIFLGILIVLAIPFISYLIFKRGDFYK